MQSPYRIILVFLSGMLTCLLGACQPIPPNVELASESTPIPAAETRRECALWFSPVLLNMDVGSLSIVDAQDQLAENMGLDSNTDPRLADFPKQRLVAADDEHDYLLHFVDNNLRRISVLYDDDARPSIANAITCLGVPAAYEITLEERNAPYLIAEFWWPDLGIMVRSSQYRPDMSLPPLDGTMLATGFSRFVPGTLEAMTRERYSTQLVADFISLVEKGDWMDVRDVPPPEEIIAFKLAGQHSWTGWDELVIRDCYVPESRCFYDYPDIQ